MASLYGQFIVGKSLQNVEYMNDPLKPVSTFDASIVKAGSAMVALVALSLFAMLAACSPAGSQPFPGMPPPEVAVVTVQPKTIPVSYEYTGQVAGYRDVEVRARVAGILQQRNFTEGDAVAKGRSLYSIDRAPYESALARAEADLAGASRRRSAMPLA
jgi:membrane fusion protein, multidrug efflux system